MHLFLKGIIWILAILLIIALKVFAWQRIEFYQLTRHWFP